MIIEKIQNDRTSFRKTGNTLGLEWATVLFSEVVMVGKNKGNRDTTEEEAIGVIKAFIKNIDFTIEQLRLDNSVSAIKKVNSIESEKEYYLSLLPRQLTENELVNIVKNYVSEGNKNMGEIMKFLNSEFNGQFNGKIASEIVKRIIT